MKPTYEELEQYLKNAEAKIQELEKELAVAKIAISNDEENIRRLYEAEKELETLKSYSTGEVDEVAKSICKTNKIGELSEYYPWIVKEISTALSSIHQKYRGELGEAVEALKPFGEKGWYLNKDDNNMHPSVRGSISFNDVVRAREALTKLTKLIGGK